jgi:hypothetical protein
MLAWVTLALIHPLTHIHDPDGDDDGDHCTVCMALQAASFALVVAPPVTVPTPAPEPVACPECRPMPVANPLPVTSRAPPQILL